jgi:hypothetical protein
MERELWMALYALAVELDDRWGKWLYSTSDVLAVYFWAVVHDRPMSWALVEEHWPEDLRPPLPSQSQFSRRMRSPATCDLMVNMECTWQAILATYRFCIQAIDGKSLTVSGVSKDADAAYGRAAGGMAKGYKLHAVWAGGPLPTAWALAPMNVSERTIGKLLISTLPGSGYLLGDAEYDANHLFATAHEAGYQLVAPKRQKHRGIGHRRQHPARLRSIELMKCPFGKALYRFRRQIERDFANLVSFGSGLASLPAWVRRFPRVRNWVHAKLLINAARWFANHPAVLADA